MGHDNNYMQYKNRPDIPAPILRAIQADHGYSTGVMEHLDSIPEQYRDKALSVTTVIRSPRQNLLIKRHSDEIEVDPMEHTFRLFGTNVHITLEKFSYDDDLIEQRFGVPVGDWYVHGQIDRYSKQDGNVLQDWKVSSVWKALKSDDDDGAYEAQLNINKFILQSNGIQVDKIQIVYIFRDWSRAQAATNPNYPSDPVLVVEHNPWSNSKIASYLYERVDKYAKAKELPDDKLPFCTDKERWMKPPSYKVFKINKDGTAGGRAARVFDTEQEANEWVANKGNSTEYQVVKHNADPGRCDYCEAKVFCNQRQEELKTGIVKSII